MALIVETGTGASDSDSYISLVDARAYGLKYGYTLPIDDDLADVALRKGVLYADLFESSYSGTRVNDDQALAWPRNNAYKCVRYDQIAIANDSIPVEIQNAQVIAASFYGAGLDVRANDDGNSIASEEVVGAVKVSYFDNGKTGASIEITEATDMLTILMCIGSSLSMRTVRV
tara:strand:- start:1719 stop:2237 length:519 start_codon:yes stop_codon:yes gene_type:complete